MGKLTGNGNAAVTFLAVVKFVDIIYIIPQL